MLRKFECWKCEHTFEADDKDWVECPKCHSDNVEYATTHYYRDLKRKIYTMVPSRKVTASNTSKVKATISNRWKMFMGVSALVFVGVVIARKCNNTPPPPPSGCLGCGCQDCECLNCEGPVCECPDCECSCREDPPPPPGVYILNHSEPDYDKEAGKYKIEVSCNPTPDFKYHFEIRKAFDEVIIAKSADGKFENISHSEDEGGIYRILAIVDQNDSILDCKECPGFIKQVKVREKMTADQLQKLIDDRSDELLGIGECDYLAPDYKLLFIDLPSDAVNKPKVLADVFEKLDNEIWTSVKVSKLEYDDMNRINKITLTVSE